MNNEENLNVIPEPEGIEKLEGRERTDEVIDEMGVVQEIEQIDGAERAQQYFDSFKLSRNEYKTIKKMDREQMTEFFSNYVENRTRRSVGLYTQIVLGQYLEALTTILKSNFGFTEEQIDELNKLINRTPEVVEEVSEEVVEDTEKKED